MPKKSRRAKAKARAAGRSPKGTTSHVVKQSNQDVEPKETIPAVQSVGPVRSSGHEYVLSELRRIGIIAGFLFLIIIILTFILN
jgi:hypothetical protein